MCTLKAHFQCYDRFFEVYPNEVEHNELILENIFSQLLINFFEEVMVDVSIDFPPHEELAIQHCVIQVYAHCDNRIYSSISDTDDKLEVCIEHEMSSILSELFCTVIVDNIRFLPSPQHRAFAQSGTGKK